MTSPATDTVASVIPSLHCRNAPAMDAKQEGHPRPFGDCDAWMERAA